MITIPASGGPPAGPVASPFSDSWGSKAGRPHGLLYSIPSYTYNTSRSFRSPSLFSSRNRDGEYQYTESTLESLILGYLLRPKHKK